MPVSCPQSSRQSLPARSVYNPVGFDPIEVLPVHLHRYADHARYFLHVLYTQRVFKDVTEEYVALKAAYLSRKGWPTSSAPGDGSRCRSACKSSYGIRDPRPLPRAVELVLFEPARNAHPHQVLSPRLHDDYPVGRSFHPPGTAPCKEQSKGLEHDRNSGDITSQARCPWVT